MKFIILDRDGVINQDSKNYIKSVEEWQAIPGSLQAIAHLCHNGYRVIVVSNQAGLARRKLNIVTLNEINRKLLDHLSQYGGTIDAFFFCPHDPNTGCDCRKPKTGLLDQIRERLHIPLSDVFMVGDKASDIEAALAAGAKPVLVKTGHGQETLDGGNVPADVPVFANLAEAVEHILPAN